MGYDNSMFEGFGLEEDGYEGECLYFTGGSVEIGTGDTSAMWDAFAEGYCLECDDLAGCSPTQSCDDVATAPTESTSLYTMSMNGSNAKSSSAYRKASDSETQSVYKADNIALMRLESATKESEHSSNLKFVGGTVLGLLTLTLLVAAIQKWNKKRSRNQTDQPISESLSPGIEFA